MSTKSARAKKAICSFKLFHPQFFISQKVNKELNKKCNIGDLQTEE